MQNRFLRLCFGFLLLAIVGCSPPRTQTVPTTFPTETVTTALFTLTPPIASQTSTALIIPSATIATVAVAPTLETDQAYRLLQQVIAGSSNCKLPCWAEIQPGVTTKTEAESLVQPLSILIYGGPFYPYRGKHFSGGGGSRHFLFGDTELRFRFGWYSEQDQDTVEMLRINADALQENSRRVYGAEPYKQLFEPYNLHNILSQYGIPYQVWTIADVYYFGNDQPNPTLPEEFRLLLFYDQGIFVQYTMPLTRLEGAKGKACPSEAFFDLGLVAQDTSQFYQMMWFAFATGSQDFTYYMPVEKATQMTFDEFYQSFKESNTPCFEIPLTIWPKR